uniref:Uncharacterized protein n=1 Tax=Heliothis virescens TaxID=7102 RepID=A0A2A4IZ46_HELVI
MFLLLLTSFISTSNAAELITVYGDVHKDVEFFTRTFPWIIDNIGGDLVIDYAMLGSGKYSVPQMCALKELTNNTFLQAQYLKCEAEGKYSEYCLCETGINPRKFKQCVVSGGHLASSAAASYAQLGINYSPIIGLGSKSTVFGVNDTLILQKICTIFGHKLPIGCAKPCDCNCAKRFSNKKAIAQFDRDCMGILDYHGDEDWYEEDSTEWDPSDYFESSESEYGTPEEGETSTRSFVSSENDEYDEYDWEYDENHHDIEGAAILNSRKVPDFRLDNMPFIPTN